MEYEPARPHPVRSRGASGKTTVEDWDRSLDRIADELVAQLPDLVGVALWRHLTAAQMAEALAPAFTLRAEPMPEAGRRSMHEVLADLRAAAEGELRAAAGELQRLARANLAERPAE